jgi:hypothetical protein
LTSNNGDVQDADCSPNFPQRAIRDFLKVRTSYDVLPLSFRLIIFDTALTVKESLNILVLNGELHPSRFDKISCSCRVLIQGLLGPGIVSAPLWDSVSSTFAGILTTADYMNVIQYYSQNPAALGQIDKFLLSNLRGAPDDPSGFTNSILNAEQMLSAPSELYPRKLFP